MGNIDCIANNSLPGVDTNSKNTLQFLLISAVCAILLIGVIATKMKPIEYKDYAQVINEQKARQAFAMRTDLAY
nr:hypothetical protein [Desulfobulbaceae bacterium]